jgi:septum formation protein
MTLGAGRLTLASGSPRRREILASLGEEFDVFAADVDESARADESPRDMALRLAELKAVAASRGSDRLTVGADTVVDVDGEAFGKPKDRDDALRMLGILSGRPHFVHTGIAVAESGELLSSAVETTKVFFGDVEEEELRRFAESGDGDDKAGAYAIQGRGALLVERIEGCYYNVVGLPVFKLRAMLKEIAHEPQTRETGDEPL